MLLDRWRAATDQALVYDWVVWVGIRTSRASYEATGTKADQRIGLGRGTMVRWAFGYENATKSLPHCTPEHLERQKDHRNGLLLSI